MRSQAILAAFLFAFLLQVSGIASACSPSIASASYFVQHAPPDGVGFSGTVLLIAQEPAGKFGTPLIITVKTKAWYLGRPQEIMKIHGFTTFNTANVPCHGVFDFHPTVGTKVVVFGRVLDGVVSRRSGILNPLPPVLFSYK